MNIPKAIAHLLRAYRCDKCPSVFSSENDLKEHLTTVHQIIAYQCLQCSAIFSSEKGLKQHLAIAHKHKTITVVDENGVQGVILR